MGGRFENLILIVSYATLMNSFDIKSIQKVTVTIHQTRERKLEENNISEIDGFKNMKEKFMTHTFAIILLTLCWNVSLFEHVYIEEK